MQLIMSHMASKKIILQLSKILGCYWSYSLNHNIMSQ